MNQRQILHIDMNSCYASIEQAQNPQLQNKAVAVCGDPEARHGIILAKSQEAKRCGVKTGEAIWQARQKCPQLITVPAHFELYLKYSRLAHSIYLDYTDRVEPFGIDECWLDVSHSRRLFGDGSQIARIIRQRIKKELGITVSVGISDNKIFAKLGSDYKKPDAQTRIDPSNYQSIAWPLPASSMIFVGPRTAKKLEKYGIQSIGDLAQANPSLIHSLLGINGDRLRLAANGLDPTPVAPYDFRAPVKSIGCGTTFRYDLKNEKQVYRALLRLSQEVSRRLIQQGLSANGLVCSVRGTDLHYVDQYLPLAYPTQNSMELAQTGLQAFRRLWTWKQSIRSMTLRANRLVSCKRDVQTLFFADYPAHDKKEKVEQALYGLRQRFGNRAVLLASLLHFDACDLESVRSRMPSNNFIALQSKKEEWASSLKKKQAHHPECCLSPSSKAKVW